MTSKKKHIRPIHPGEILLEDFMEPNQLTQYRLAKELAIPRMRINQIVNSNRGITADTALRLAKFFGTTEQFWLNLQNAYDLMCARQKYGAKIDKEVHPFIEDQDTAAA